MTVRRPTGFTQRTSGRTTVLEAQGELDTASASAFRAALQAAVDTGHPLVVVDLQQVSFLDSAGLSVVFGAQRQLPPGRRIVLGNVPPRMLRTLRLASVTSVVDVHAQGEPQPWQDGPAA